MDRKREIRFALYGVAELGRQAAEAGDIRLCGELAKCGLELMSELLPLLGDGPYKREVEKDLIKCKELIAQYDELN